MLSDSATPQQRTLIARLNMALGNREPTEEYPMTRGQAGKLIRKMLAEAQARKRSTRILR